MSEGEADSTPFHRLLGARCLVRENGRSRYELALGPEHLNRRGVAHGGVVASLLDTAMGTAVVWASAAEEWWGTMVLSLQFRGPVRHGVIVGEGRMVRRGRTAAFAEGEVLDPSGKVLAVAHGVWTIWPVKPS